MPSNATGAVERAGLGTLNDGQGVSYNVVEERGKQTADDLRRSRP